IDVEFLYTAQDPTLYRARDIAETIIDLFLHGELDEVYIIFTEMVTSMKMEPRCYKLLPLERTNFDVAEKNTYRQCAAFMPTPEIVMDHLVPNYLKGLIYSILVEAYSSEQNARMMAMESATDSAKEMIRDLSLQFNRARQAAITQEITEVVSGAESLNL
ncbi:MAG TPA: F0F1 ATP synthase subunit gamma, partial [Candidatus Aphodoplasma excrementigallinarum]|nr:F0F1 ATP synthase subunit gamma [Candidatus Aphodoplasma excrementigallinarum]